MGVFNGNSIYNYGAGGGGGGGGVGVWEDFLPTIAGTGGQKTAKINRELKEILINVSGRRLNFSGNADTLLVTLPDGISFNGFVIGMAWINEIRDMQFNNNLLGIARNCIINNSTPNPKNLYCTFCTVGSYYSLNIRALINL